MIYNKIIKKDCKEKYKMYDINKISYDCTEYEILENGELKAYVFIYIYPQCIYFDILDYADYDILCDIIKGIKLKFNKLYVKCRVYDIIKAEALICNDFNLIADYIYPQYYLFKWEK